MAVFQLSISNCLLQPLEHAYNHHGRQTCMNELPNGNPTRHGRLKVKVFYFFIEFGLKLMKARIMWVSEKLGQLTRGVWGPTGLVLLSDYHMYYYMIKLRVILFPDIRAEKWPTQGINSCSKFTTDTQETDS